ncbi:Molybdenum cofactor biosynthesis pathway protein [Plasmopara halstedii]|uniref:Molybdenum cofactor biosynthesis pathway protein n=1 Tax=Plasmopara halstedii TaxID=4781 RepID=A0A0P1B1V1_PLAHL|nr:Molybdenum cofactor biosynthesis pathway protein [Plasmopara halstedii]CEG47400.1 Molybdenum cofactor biosynthesis pathway protein [Plasmopara halstedii]|eukprot:XP_024583769.1 Molybdenum cofactor biosynthesis pathway protein [Plasmopara halstedii]
MWQRAVRSLRFVSRVYSSAADDAWKLTHVSQDRALPHMVNVGSKPITQRSATACTTIRLPPTVLTELLKGGGDQLLGPKGPIASTAVIAGVLGAKQTSLLLPFCHPLPLEDCQVTIQVIKPNIIEIQCQSRYCH